MGSQSYTTRTLQDTLNPKWNFNCQFFIKDLYQDVLCLTMFDRDQFSPDGKADRVPALGPSGWEPGRRAFPPRRPGAGGPGPRSPRLAWQLGGCLPGTGSLGGAGVSDPVTPRVGHRNGATRTCWRG